MGLPSDYMKYAHRGYGMDHDRYDWSMLPGRQPVTWPGNCDTDHWPMNWSLS